MNQDVKLTIDLDVNASVNGKDWGDIQSRRFWWHAFRWNLDRGAWRALAGNLKDFPSYMKGKR